MLLGAVHSDGVTVATMSCLTGGPAALLARMRGIGNAPMGFKEFPFFRGMLRPCQKSFSSVFVEVRVEQVDTKSNFF